MKFSKYVTCSHKITETSAGGQLSVFVSISRDIRAPSDSLPPPLTAHGNHSNGWSTPETDRRRPAEWRSACSSRRPGAARPRWPPAPPGRWAERTRTSFRLAHGRAARARLTRVGRTSIAHVSRFCVYLAHLALLAIKIATLARGDYRPVCGRPTSCWHLGLVTNFGGFISRNTRWGNKIALHESCKSMFRTSLYCGIDECVCVWCGVLCKWFMYDKYVWMYVYIYRLD